MTTVFYSWQSDLPNRTNRTFIEDALAQALEGIASGGTIEKPDRGDTLVLDKDTKDVPGIPPIAQVIFDKIARASVFVPDLTFVGATEDGRLLPNPNVLIEHGWALAKLGHSRIVPVMNTARGEATHDTLPFDMRHLRKPITYCLPENADSTERGRVKAALVREFTMAIGLILKSHSEGEADAHQPVQSTANKSTFLQPGEPLGVFEPFLGQETTLIVPDNEHLFLRLIPIARVEPIGSATKAQNLLTPGTLRPLGDQLTGWDCGRNRYGAFACSHNRERVGAFAQVFLNREIWGLDAGSIDKELLMRLAERDFGFFPCVHFESVFTTTLANWLQFCKDVLQLPLPLKFIAGATGVEGYRMTPPSGMYFRGMEQFAGRAVQNDIYYEGRVDDYGGSVAKMLRPFFEHLWEECGLTRPDREHL